MIFTNKHDQISSLSQNHHHHQKSSTDDKKDEKQKQDPKSKSIHSLEAMSTIQYSKPISFQSYKAELIKSYYINHQFDSLVGYKILNEMYSKGLKVERDQLEFEKECYLQTSSTKPP